MAKELTAQEQRFVNEYLIDLCLKDAAIRAGYSPRSASVTASRLMNKEKVRDAIEIAMAERSRRCGISQDRVLNELAKIAFVNIGDIVDLEHKEVKGNLSPDDMSAISSVKFKDYSGEDSSSKEISIEMQNKIKALEMVGKHLGMWNDKLHVTTDTELNINIDSGGFDEC